MGERIKFTNGTLAALTPGEKLRYVYDEVCGGLALSVAPGGSKVFFRIGRVAGRPQRLRIGPFPKISIEQARKACAALSGEVAQGKDPAAERASRKAKGKTFEEVFLWYMEHHSKLKKTTWQRDERRYKAHLTEWGKKPIHNVNRAMVAELHAKIGRERGPRAGNHMLDLVKSVCRTSIANGWSDVNPTLGIKRFPELQRDRFLTEDELPKFFAAVEQLQRSLSRDFLLLLLWTGARRGNVESMRWDEIDLAAATWTIPKEKFKSRRVHVVPLILPALEILARRVQERTDGCPWVLPSHGASGHITWPKSAWQTVLRKSGLSNLRIHDLRRTMGSVMAAGGGSLQIIGKALGHSSTKTTQIYARLHLDPVRLAMEAAGKTMQGGKGQPDRIK